MFRTMVLNFFSGHLLPTIVLFRWVSLITVPRHRFGRLTEAASNVRDVLPKPSSVFPMIPRIQTPDSAPTAYFFCLLWCAASTSVRYRSIHPNHARLLRSPPVPVHVVSFSWPPSLGMWSLSSGASGHVAMNHGAPFPAYLGSVLLMAVGPGPHCNILLGGIFRAATAMNLSISGGFTNSAIVHRVSTPPDLPHAQNICRHGNLFMSKCFDISTIRSRLTKGNLSPFPSCSASPF